MSYNHAAVTQGEGGAFRSLDYDRRYDAVPNHPYWTDKTAQEIRLLSHLIENDPALEQLIDLTGDDWTQQAYYTFYRRVRIAVLSLPVIERHSLTASNLFEFSKEVIAHA